MATFRRKSEDLVILGFWFKFDSLLAGLRGTLGFLLLCIFLRELDSNAIILVDIARAQMLSFL